jgi:hypothetical protein
VPDPRGIRERLASVLNAAFAEGLLSQETHSYRLGLLFGPQLVDPDALVGDLALRTQTQTLAAPASALGALWRYAIRRARRSPAVTPLVLALEWVGERDAVVIGRDTRCDIVVSEGTVSRHHARLVFRDGTCVVQDLQSTNGTAVNGKPVGRCQLHRGDRLRLGRQLLDID